MKAYLLIILLFTLTYSAFAQAPDSLWSHTYGGSTDDYCYSVKQTTDGGYILAGQTSSFGAGYEDFYLVKTDASGDSQWSHTYGGGSYDECYSVQQTSDGGYILAGGTASFGAGGWDIWLLKTDANGDSLWSRTFGGSNHDNSYSVQQTSDGGYIVAGYTSSLDAGGFDFWLVKTDVSGIQQWSRTFGGSGVDECYSVQQTIDGGYVLGGQTSSFGVGTPFNPNFWLVKTDVNGDSLWSRTFGGYDLDDCYSIQQVTDGGYILAGRTWSFGAGNSDFWLVKTNSNGDSLWSRTFGGSFDEWCFSVEETTDGGYILAGRTYSFGVGTPSNPNFWLVKTNANGDSLWSRTLGGNSFDECRSIQLTTDGCYILAGETYSFGAGGFDFWLVRTEPDIALGSLLFISPTEVNFGLQDIGADSVATIVLSNPGALPSVIHLVSHSLSEFVVDTSGLNGQISPNSTYNLHVTFAPTVNGTYQDTLVIIAERAGDDTLLVPFYGEAAFIPVAPESLVVRRGTSNSMNLWWAPVTHTISGQAFTPPYYVIYSSTSEAGPFVPIGSSETASYVHSGIVVSQSKYFYQVTASSVARSGDEARQ